MPSWLDRLERRAGFLAIPGLAIFLAGMNAAVAVLSQLKPEFPFMLDLQPELLRQGQVWRILTFLFVPPPMSLLWLFFWLLLFYAYSSRLEQAWGDFRFTLFCLVGALGTVAASLICGRPFSNSVFQAGLFLAFARLYPEFEILLFFVVPMRMKWLGLIAWLGILVAFILGSFSDRIYYALGLANYFIFFGSDLRRQADMIAHKLRHRGKRWR